MTTAVQRWPWPPTEELKASEQQLQRDMESEVASFESRYGMSSSELTARLRAGEIAEDAELCRWLMDLEMLQALSCAGGE